MEIRDYGPIRLLELPGEWTELPANDDPLRPVRTRRFQSSTDPRRQFQIISQLQRWPSEVADVFHSHIQSRSTKSADTVLTELMPIVGQLADKRVFACVRIQPLKLHSRDALWVEGNWLQPPLAMCSVFADVESSGAVVEQFIWLAPPDAAQTHMFKAILESIRWTA